MRRMGDEKQQHAVNQANRLPAIFAAFDPILLAEGERIKERTRRRLERDTMFSPIGLRLRGIPFETKCYNNIVTTDTPLCQWFKAGPHGGRRRPGRRSFCRAMPTPPAI